MRNRCNDNRRLYSAIPRAMIDALEPRRLLALVVGTGGADTIIITASGGSTTVNLNGVSGSTGDSSIVVRGGGGNDVIRVRSTRTGTDVDVFGEDGNDLLVNDTLLDLDAVYLADVLFDGGNGTDSIVADNGNDSTTFADIQLNSGGIFKGQLPSLISYTSLELLDFWDSNGSNRIGFINMQGPQHDIVNLRIHGNGGNDTIANTSTANPTLGYWPTSIGTGGLFVDGGTGTDTLVLDDEQDLSETWDIDADSVDGHSSQSTAGPITYTTCEALDLFTTPNGDLFNITGKLNSVSYRIDGNGGNDTFNVGGGDIDSNAFLLSNTTLIGGAGTDSIRFDDHLDAAGENDVYTFGLFTIAKGSFGFNYSSFDTQTLDTSNGTGGQPNTVALNALSGQIGNTTINGGTLRTTTVNMGNGNLVNLSGNFTMNLPGGRVNVFDQNDTGADNYNFSSTSMFKTVGLSTQTTISYTGVATFVINANSGANNITVSSNPAGTALSVDGGGGDDVFNIGVPGFDAELVDGSVGLNGAAGADTFAYNDISATGTPSYLLNSTQLFRGGNGTVTYATMEGVRVEAGGGDNNMVYNNTSGIEIPVTLNGHDGNDSFEVDITLALTIGGSPNTVDGGAGTDTLTIFNSVSIAGYLDITIIRNNFLNIVGANDLNYTNFESLFWNAQVNEGKSICVLSTAASTPVTINGSSGPEFFRVGGLPNFTGVVSLDPILGAVSLNGNDGTDTVSYNDHDTTAANTYALSGNTLTRSGSATVTFGTSENVDINAGSAADIINVLDHPIGVTVTVDGRAGLDTVNVNMDNAGAATARFATTQDLAALNIGAGGTGILTAGANKVIDTDGLSIDATGKLDLGDGSLIVDFAAGNSPLLAVRTALASGRNGGAWNGNGINSSLAAITPTRALGHAESSEIFTTFPATFAGRQVDNTAVLVRYTRYGDADLNGVVDFDDYSRTDAGFNNNRTGWTNGDFDYNNQVDFDDYSLIDQAFNTQVTALRPAVPPLSGTVGKGGGIVVH